MKRIEVMDAFPQKLQRLVDAFAYFVPDPDTSDGASPVIDVDVSFLQAYTDAYTQYARPDKVAHLSAGNPLFSYEVARDLLANNGEQVAITLARLSFELIAQHIDSNGESIPRDQLHSYLRVVWYRNERVVESCDTDVDPSFEELNFALMCLEGHWAETQRPRKARALRQYRFPYRFSTW